MPRELSLHQQLKAGTLPLEILRSSSTSLISSGSARAWIGLSTELGLAGAVRDSTGLLGNEPYRGIGEFYGSSEVALYCF